jgi:2-haloacid dehalogenase
VADRAGERWVTFDCYGTLIDWERGIKEAMGRLWPSADTDALLARYHEIEPRVQSGSGAPYRAILAEVLNAIADAESLALPAAERDALAASLPGWPSFPDVPDALRAVRSSGWHTAILSNTDPDLLDASIANIGVAFDLRITAAEAGSYKPAHGHWHRFLASSGADRSTHVHVGASIYHDITPALELGLSSVWINRKAEHSDVHRSAELPDLCGLRDVLDELVPEGVRG